MIYELNSSLLDEAKNLYSKQGNPLTNIGNSQYQWTIEAELINCTNENATLIFQTQGTLSSNGTVNFENMGISSYTESCRVRFHINTPVGVNE